MSKLRPKLLAAALTTAILACPSFSLAATGQEAEAEAIVTWDTPVQRVAPSKPEAKETNRMALGLGATAPGAPSSSTELDLLHTGWSKETKLKVLNVGILGGMMVYGLIYWGYGETTPQFVNEGWFEYDSPHGGADKLGHAISTYFAVQAFAYTYERWGYDRHHANLYGTLSAWSTFFMIEVGDAFSRHGFSVEDLVFDTLGALTGYLRREHPGFERRVDFRAEYWPSYGARKGEDTDYASDYSGYKYVMALKGDGFDTISSTWLRYFELQAGYYTRGYQSQDEDYYGDPYRVIYGAVAVNLSHIFDKHNWNKTATFLHYYQVPYTYLPVEYNFDR